MREIENHAAKPDIFEILGAIKENFTKLGPESWVHEYLHEKAKAAFEEDHTVFKSEAFLESLDNAALNKFMMKCVMDLYNDKISHMLTTEKELSQKLDDRIQTIRSLSVEEAAPEQNMAIQEDFTPLANEPTVENCCGQEVFEQETVSTEEFCTISCPPSECLVEPTECPEGPTVYPGDACPDESIPVAQCCASDYSVPECSTEATQAPMEDVAVTEITEVPNNGWEEETKEAQPAPEPDAMPEPELSEDSICVSSKKKETMKERKVRERRERHERLERQEKQALELEERKRLEAAEAERTAAKPKLKFEYNVEVQPGVNSCATGWGMYGRASWGIAESPSALEAIPQEAECVPVSSNVQEIDCEPPPQEPIEDVCLSEPAGDELCPYRARHIFEGSMRRTCRPCRAIVEQVILQLARADSDGVKDWLRN